MSILQALSQGLRAAAATGSQSVYNTQRQEEQTDLDRKQRMKELTLGVMIKAVESGAMAPEKLQQWAQQTGTEMPGVGPTADTQVNQQKLRDAEDLKRREAEFDAGFERPPVNNPNMEGLDPTVVEAERTNLDEYALRAEQAIKRNLPERADRYTKLAEVERKSQERKKESKTQTLLNDQAKYPVGSPEWTAFERQLNQVSPVKPDQMKVGVNNGKREYFYMKEGAPVWMGVEAPDQKLVDINMTQEKAEGKAVGDGYGKRYIEIQDAARLAQRRAIRMDRLNELLEGVETGKLTPLGTEIAAYAESLGFKIDKNLGNKQAAEALANEVALELRNPSGGAGMPGALSDNDLKFLISMRPGLSTSPEGRKLQTETIKKLAQRDNDVARIARAYRKKHGQLDEGFEDELEEWSNKNPLFGNMPEVKAKEKEAGYKASKEIKADFISGKLTKDQASKAFEEFYEKNPGSE